MFRLLVSYTEKCACSLKISMLCVLCRPTVSMAYYGLAMNPNFLGGDAYLAFIVGGVLEIIAILIVLLTMNIVGRKILCSGGFLFAALCLLLTLAVPDGEHFFSINSTYNFLLN